MKNTSSRSAKATPKAVPEQATNGTPPTDQLSEPTFVESTEWTLFKTDGDVLAVKVTGGRGRVSMSGALRSGGGDVRIYRNESTKVFDAAFSGVEAVYSDRVKVEKIYNKREAQKSMMVKMAKAPTLTLTAPTPWHDLSPMEQSEYETRARSEGGFDSGKDLYEREAF